MEHDKSRFGSTSENRLIAASALFAIISWLCFRMIFDGLTNAGAAAFAAPVLGIATGVAVYLFGTAIGPRKDSGGT